MKRGDTIAKETNLDIGSVVAHNLSSEEKAKAYMETDFLQQHGILPSYKLENGEIVLTQTVIQKEEATVNWVIDGACAIRFKDGSYRIFEIADEPEWKVIVESVPSYQSSVENLSDEDLRKAIDDLRAQRTFITAKPRKTPTKREAVDKNDPMAQVLASMSPEKKLELMKKMGMVD